MDCFADMCLLSCRGMQFQVSSKTMASGIMEPACHNKFTQVCNYVNRHWLTIASDDCKRIRVYDSLCQRVTRLESHHLELIRVVKQLTLSRAEVIEWVVCQQQLDGYNCGPFALAAVWALSQRRQPMAFRIDGTDMRKRILQSIEGNIVVGLRDRLIDPTPVVRLYSRYHVRTKFLTH